jgi:calcium-dependent protein kinase
MGVLLYILISGAPPFYGSNDQEILKSVKAGKFEFDCTYLSKFLSACLEDDK